MNNETEPGRLILRRLEKIKERQENAPPGLASVLELCWWNYAQFLSVSFEFLPTTTFPEPFNTIKHPRNPSLINRDPDFILENLKDKLIVVQLGWGVGDEIRFATPVNELCQNNEVFIITNYNRNLPLFRRSFPKATVLVNPLPGRPAKNEQDVVTPFQMTLLSLKDNFILFVYKEILCLRSRCSLFPNPPRPFLMVDSEKKSKWQDRYKSLGDGLKVGISWYGGSTEKRRKSRSTSLNQWEPIFSVPGVRWVNLQYGDHREEIQQAEEAFGVTIHDWPDSDPLKDLDDFAAKIAALDLVISIDNSTVYYAGAQGIPVWMLTSRFWLQEFEDTPWFASLRLFRQSTPGDWGPVIKRVAEELRMLVETGTTTPIDPDRSYKPIFEMLAEEGL